MWQLSTETQITKVLIRGWQDMVAVNTVHQQLHTVFLYECALLMQTMHEAQ